MAAVPNWVPKRHRNKWRHPWTFRARHWPRFKRLCLQHGYLSPNFTVKEAACKDGTQVPKRLRANAQRHAFNLERLRHDLGDRPLRILSWYRTPSHNAAVGGASQSRHMQADATDFTSQFINAVGRARWNAATNRIFSDGGVGNYSSGSGHVDSRGFKARW